MASKVENSLNDIIDVFHEYSFSNTPDDYLQEEEFKRLLRENATDFLRDTKPFDLTLEQYLDLLFHEADIDNSGHIQFEEFVRPLARLAINAHNKSHEPRGTGHGNPDHEHRQRH